MRASKISDYDFRHSSATYDGAGERQPQRDDVLRGTRFLASDVCFLPRITSLRLAGTFERAIASARPGSGFAARAARLRSLARGEAGPLVTSLREAAAEEPQLTLRFVRQLLERIEGEDRDVRAGNLPLLKLLAELLESLAVAKEGRPAAQSRIARELLDRTRGILEGLHHVETSPAGKAHALSPRREAFAGNVRLAPADPLPWPFAAPAAEAPSAFVPLVLQPVEWRDGKGALVFGWRLTE
jgi:hypothetical protein